MAPVDIYTIEYCPFCSIARAVLQGKGVAYTDHDLSGLTDSERASRMEALCGRATVPQIWIGGRHIGGCTDLQSLDEAGELDRLLQGDP